jgi:PTH1 family peptidyl-tRNA hydrolase
MKAIIGLGNPGSNYQDTRHNIGFKVIDSIADKKRIIIKKNSYNSLIGVGKIESKEVMLAKPLTYMNLSGKAVKAIVDAKEIALEDVLIICDDTNLPVGNIRFRTGGSHGGHNGLKSISAALMTTNYPRLRIGVGETQREAQGDLASFVLSKPNKGTLVDIKKVVEKAEEAVYMWLKKGIEDCMNFFNEKVKD